MGRCNRPHRRIGSFVLPCTRPKGHVGFCEHYNGAQAPFYSDHLTADEGREALEVELRHDSRRTA